LTMRNCLTVAMRGRGEKPTKQQLEPRFDGLVNALTTVQKDNLILEISDVENELGNNDECSNYRCRDYRQKQTQIP